MDQLEKIIRSIREDAYEDGQNGAGHPHSIDNDKQAITSLIKELVAEARINEIGIMQHQARVNLKTSNAVADWGDIRIAQLKAQQEDKDE